MLKPNITEVMKVILAGDARGLTELMQLGMPEADKEEAGNALLERFNKKIFETLVLNLDEEGVARLSRAADGGDLEAEVEALSASVPDLGKKLSEAIDADMSVILEAYRRTAPNLE
jgi:hypothetical protein